MKTLSVILPNYNHARFLDRSLGAISADPTPSQIIVIDDGSTDDSLKVIEGFARRDSRIIVMGSGENSGAMNCMIRGLLVANGDYIYFAAADDCILPGFLGKTMMMLRSFPQAGLCCAIGEWREASTGLRWLMGDNMCRQSTCFNPDDVERLDSFGRLFIPTHASIVKRTAYFEAGWFDGSLKYATDYCYYLIAFQYGMCVVPEVLAINNIYPGGSYQGGIRDVAGHEKVLVSMLGKLNSEMKPRSLLNGIRGEGWSDSVGRMKRSGALYIWGWPMILTMRRHGYEEYINALLVAKVCIHSLLRFVKRITPTPILNRVVKLSQGF